LYVAYKFSSLLFEIIQQTCLKRVRWHYIRFCPRDIEPLADNPQRPMVLSDTSCSRCDRISH